MSFSITSLSIMLVCVIVYLIVLYHVVRVHHSDAIKYIYLLADAKALVDRGSVTYKSHTLVISRPSEPAPTRIEEVKPSAQRPSSLQDMKETPRGHATVYDQSICESSTVNVRNIPEYMSEDMIRMIFENKRFGGGGEVTDIVYEKGRGSAVVTFSDPEGIYFIHLLFLH